MCVQMNYLPYLHTPSWYRRVDSLLECVLKAWVWCQKLSCLALLVSSHAGLCGPPLLMTWPSDQVMLQSDPVQGYRVQHKQINKQARVLPFSLSPLVHTPSLKVSRSPYCRFRGFPPPLVGEPGSILYTTVSCCHLSLLPLTKLVPRLFSSVCKSFLFLSALSPPNYQECNCKLSPCSPFLLPMSSLYSNTQPLPSWVPSLIRPGLSSRYCQAHSFTTCVGQAPHHIRQCRFRKLQSSKFWCKFFR